MEYMELANGVRMPMLGFGTVGIEGEKGMERIEKAIETGYRLIDTARMYHNEEVVGAAIARSRVARNELFITTKLCRTSNSYEKAKRDIEDSLHQLKLEYVDLLLVHEPYLESYDMYQAIKEAYESGKARAIGVSNFNEKCYREFIDRCEMIPAINQMESHVYFTQFKLKEIMAQYGTKMQAWSPLANGANHLFKEEVLLNIGKKYGKSVAQVALRYLTQNGVSAIPKTISNLRIKENLDIFDFNLTKGEVLELIALDKNESLTDWYRSDWF